MKTHKFPIYTQNKEDKNLLKKLQQQFSSAVHYSYNRILEDISSSIIEQNFKTLENVDLLDSWFIRCARLKAEAILKSVKELNKIREKDEEPIDPKKIVFGTKFMFYQRLKGKITKLEFKENRLMKINVQGELNQDGNRKFHLDLDNNRILFKLNKKHHIVLGTPNLRKNMFKELRKIQEYKMLFSVELGSKEIYISFDETDVKNSVYEQKKNRILGIDLNPNYIGYSIVDLPDSRSTMVQVPEENIIVKHSYDISPLNQKLMVKSSDIRQKYLNNKRDYEILNIVHQIVSQAVHYKVEKIVIEKLVINSKDHKKGKGYNRMVNNDWRRRLLIDKLKMLCRIFNIKLCIVNPCYSSFIGNLQYNYFDPVNSSIELARRGKNCYVKGSKLLPALGVKDLWKKHLMQQDEEWKSLYKKFESEDLRYRVSLEDLDPLKFYRVSYRKRMYHLYSFILLSYLRGTIIAEHNSHGLCYTVRHSDGTDGCYDSWELVVIK